MQPADDPSATSAAADDGGDKDDKYEGGGGEEAYADEDEDEEEDEGEAEATGDAADADDEFDRRQYGIFQALPVDGDPDWGAGERLRLGWGGRMGSLCCLRCCVRSPG